MNLNDLLGSELLLDDTVESNLSGHAVVVGVSAEYAKGMELLRFAYRLATEDDVPARFVVELHAPSREVAVHLSSVLASQPQLQFYLKNLASWDDAARRTAHRYARVIH